MNHLDHSLDVAHREHAPFVFFDESEIEKVFDVGHIRLPFVPVEHVVWQLVISVVVTNAEEVAGFQGFVRETMAEGDTFGFGILHLLPDAVHIGVFDTGEDTDDEEDSTGFDA